MPATTPRRQAGSIIIRRYQDAAGTPLVDVPLSRGQNTTLDADDFDHLSSCGVTRAWSANGNGAGLGYVRCALPGVPQSRNVIVARLIAKARRGQVVGYRDGNRLNLRRDNLLIVGGWSTNRTLSALDAAEWLGTGDEVAQTCRAS